MGIQREEKNRFDAIMVGSGVGSLACAASLAIEGKKVAVLEQHRGLGGYLQTFKHKKWQWNVGTHYIGSVDDVFHYLTRGRICLAPMDPDYEVMKLPEREYRTTAGRDEMIRSLTADFPHEKENIEAYFALVRQTAKDKTRFFAPRIFSYNVSRWLYGVLAFKYRNLRKKTLGDVLNEFFGDARLKLLLSLHAAKFLTSMDRLSFVYYSIIHESYNNGGFYPDGGGRSIVTALTDTIEQRGGSVRPNTRVNRILLRGKRVEGVQLEDGAVIRSDCVVSGIGIKETVERLLPKESVPIRLKLAAKDHHSTLSYIALYLGFEGDLSPFAIPKANVKVLSSTPFNFYDNPLVDDWNPHFVSIIFHSVRDRAHPDPLHHTAEILVPTDYRHFEKWKGTKVGKRGAEYRDAKDRMTGRLLDILEGQFPGIGARVAYTSLSTPVTFENYTGHNRGAVYGLESSTLRIGDMRLVPRSDIRGLYYTGTDVLMHGIFGAFTGGVLTASSIVRTNLFAKFKKAYGQSPAV